MVQRALKRATSSSETGAAAASPEAAADGQTASKVEPPAWLRAGISVEADRARPRGLVSRHGHGGVSQRL